MVESASSSSSSRSVSNDQDEISMEFESQAGSSYVDAIGLDDLDTDSQRSVGEFTENQQD